MVGFVRGIGRGGAASQMHRDRVRSQDCLKVRPHDLLDTVDLREFRQLRAVRLRSTFWYVRRASIAMSSPILFRYLKQSAIVFSTE